MSNPNPKPRKLLQCQINASKAYQARALEKVNGVVISPHEPEIFKALQRIKAHHGGNRSGAIKAAIMLYAQSLDAQS